MTGIGTWQKCPVCKESDFSNRHRCKPQWEVCDADDRPDDREWDTVRAYAADAAAEAYCALRDPFNEYGTVSASRTVLVRPIGRDDLRRQFLVTGELQPVYMAIAQALIGDD